MPDHSYIRSYKILKNPVLIYLFQYHHVWDYARSQIFCVFYMKSLLLYKIFQGHKEFTFFIY